jgi:anthranilate synthase component 1
MSLAPPLTGAATPDLSTFRELATSRRVIPVVRRLLADGQTPIGLYQTLAQGRPGTFLFESAEHGRSWSRWSIVGVRSAAVLTESSGQATWGGRPPAGVPLSGDPLDVLRGTLDFLRTESLPGLPPLTGGLVGYIGYDSVRRMEKLPDTTTNDLQIPELGMLLATDLAVLDHADGTVLLIANAVNYDGADSGVEGAYADAIDRLDAMEADLSRPVSLVPVTYDPAAVPEFTRGSSQSEYEGMVEAAKEQIRAGECFQIVVSQRFDLPTTASAVDVYRVLRATNPSPYMYLLRVPTADFESVAFDIVGSSPEALVTVRAGLARMHPIAGSMPRGATPAEDIALGDALLAHPKERAEHLMLVDLGRNDLGRVAQAGSVDVVEFMTVERYSHIMHLVSTVEGRLAPDVSAIDALVATFPAGTLSGAPKVRAMEIIDELEPTRRGLYGGVVGYLDFAGDMDVAIAIRTAVLKGGVAHVQAGAGIVADSDPATEDLESRNKAAAVLRAVAAAETMRPAAHGVTGP